MTTKPAKRLVPDDKPAMYSTRSYTVEELRAECKVFAARQRYLGDIVTRFLDTLV
jgi:hypothetical protein